MNQFKMLHSGPMTRITSTMDNLSIISTLAFLLLQFPIFHALPTTSTFTNVGSHQNDAREATVLRAPSSQDLSAYPYSSYRQGQESYRPYSGYAKDLSNVNVPEIVHPNSVYSQQSAPSTVPKTVDKARNLFAKESEASDLQQNKNQVAFPALANEKADGAPEEKKLSTRLTLTNPPASNNKPRLQPLPPVQSSSAGATNDKSEQHKDNNNKDQQDQYPQQESIRAEEFSPVPPPFAPELDPMYQRSQYGLGPLTLLDQAGPFW